MKLYLQSGIIIKQPLKDFYQVINGRICNNFNGYKPGDDHPVVCSVK